MYPRITPKVQSSVCPHQLIHLPARHRRSSIHPPSGRPSPSTTPSPASTTSDSYTPPLSTPHCPKDRRVELSHSISRLVVSTLSMATVYLPGLRGIPYIAGKYGSRRKVTDPYTGLSSPEKSSGGRKRLRTTKSIQLSWDRPESMGVDKCELRKARDDSHGFATQLSFFQLVHSTAPDSYQRQTTCID